MTAAKLPKLVFGAALLLSTLGAPAWASTPELAGKLKDLRQEKHQLEREVAQYRASIDLLRANGADGINSSTLQALSEQVGRTRAEIRNLEQRERAMLTELEGETGSTPGMLDPADREVARLTQLLNAHYASENASALGAASTANTGPDEGMPLVQLGDAKVMLTGSEGVAAINLISERLSGQDRASGLREVDIVFNVERRENGSLVSSRNYTLRSLGNGQYIGKVRLGGGNARIKVRTNQWRVEVAGDEQREYLVTLHSPATSEPQLHLIPVDELMATRWADRPDWLPPIGATSGSS